VKLTPETGVLAGRIGSIVPGPVSVGCGASAIRRGADTEPLELLCQRSVGFGDQELERLRSNVSSSRLLVAHRCGGVAFLRGRTPGPNRLRSADLRGSATELARRTRGASDIVGFRRRAALATGRSLQVRARLVLIGRELIARCVGFVSLDGGLVGVRGGLVRVRRCLIGIRGGLVGVDRPLVGLARGRPELQVLCAVAIHGTPHWRAERPEEMQDRRCAHAPYLSGHGRAYGPMVREVLVPRSDG
jgi:hypothetical protein